tara:strand:+ start:6861 stop:7925 length:1065 start_codon:yes stop_codon:yes gene_type:complete
MRILYVTRNFNHSGYYILKTLIENNISLAGILIQPGRTSKFSIFFDKILYYLESIIFGHDCIRNFKSEKQLAISEDIKILELNTLKSKESLTLLGSLNLDLIILGGGWHELIPVDIIKLPKFGCVNTHPSLLPDFRGTSITRWQVLNKPKHTGSTLHIIDENFDTGRIISQSKLVFQENQTPQSLFKDLGMLGATQVLKFIQYFNSHEKFPVLMEDKKNSTSTFSKYYSKWDWDLNTRLIDLSLDINKIHSLVMANTQENFKYHYGPFFSFNDKKYFIRKTRLLSIKEYNILFSCHLNENLSGFFFHEKNMIFKSKESEYLIIIEKVQLKTNFFSRAWNPFILKKKLNLNEKSN